MSFVLDCSVTLSWFMPEEKTTANHSLLEELAEDGAIVPSLWLIEVANTLLFAQRAKRITAHQREKVLHDLEHLPIRIDEEITQRAWHEISDLAEKNALTAYDATYLELALRLKCPLATFDKDLRKAAHRVGVPLI